jgi:pSer/pThr/pTyr-binding forkhead associated (FHA) protein
MPACPHCGVENKPGDRFCVQCGKELVADLPSLDLMDAGIVCPACDTFNEPDQKSCVRCGQSLTGMTGFLHAVSAPAAKTAKEIQAVQAPPAPGLTGTKPDLPAPAETEDPVPPAAQAQPQPAKRPTAPMPAAGAQPPPATGACPFCRARLTPGAQYCLACGRKLIATRPAVEQAADLSVRIRLVRGYGREDSTYPVGSNGITVGRSMAVINIAEDPYLSPVHMLLRTDSGRLLVEDHKSLNGTFFRVRSRAELRQGTEFIAGAQRFVLLGLGGPTTDVRTPSTPDTRPYGGPLPRQLFVALRLLHSAPDGGVLAGAVMLRSGPVISIGRQGCDLNFPDDTRMAPRHLELHLRPQGLQVTETGSSSGVFVRISRPTPLRNGDEIMAGEELFRVEMG